MKLTIRTVDSTKPQPQGDLVLWDDELPGFGLRVKPSGHKTFIVQYRNAQGRSRRVTVGAIGRLTPQEARTEARHMLADVERGLDPAEQREAGRKAPTMAELCERYLADHAAVRKKAKSAAQDRRMIERFILPQLGKRKVADVTRADVYALQKPLRHTPYQANRVLALLSKMMNLAERWGLRPDGSNPCRHVEKFKERKRERYLTAGELARLGSVLVEVECERSTLPSVVPAIRLLIFTGCRLSEILTLRWEHVDFQAECLRLPDSKTGAKMVHLNAPALAILAELPRDPSGWVITGAKDGSHLVNLELPWRRFRERAGIDDVRLHDLRHSFASVAAGLGEGLPMIGKLLGHTQAQTTHRYAHLDKDPLKRASERVGNALQGMMKGQAGELVELRRNQP